MPEQQPRLLAGRYELRTVIGRGTMGAVWRAFDRSLGREVAVKEIRQDAALSPEQRRELRERMIREGRIAAKIRHQCVATVHDAIEVDGRPWIIMELIDGRSLEKVIEDEGPLPPRLVAEMGCDLLDALRTAHSLGILHRDVKPANVLITDTGRVVLTDFGIAKADGDSPLTQTGMVIGSPGYTAPERVRGEHTGPESDLWSLGATLYFAVEGRPAFERASVSETLDALLTQDAPPPTQAGPLRPIIEGLLVKDHRKRLTAERAAMMLRLVADTPTGDLAAVRADSGPARRPGSSAAPRPPAQPGRSPAPARPETAAAEDQTIVMPIRPPAAPGSPAPAAGGPAAPGQGAVPGPATTGQAAVPGPATAGRATPASGSATPHGPAAPFPGPAAPGDRAPAPPPGPGTPGGAPAVPAAAAPDGPRPGTATGPGTASRPPAAPGSAWADAAPPPPAGDETGGPIGAHDVTVPRRLPTPGHPGAPAGPERPGPAAPPPAGAPQMPTGPGPAHPDHAGQGAPAPAAGPVPAPAASGPETAPQQGRPRGLGTDLFAMRGPKPPDVGHRVRVLVLMGLSVLAFILLVIVAMAAFGESRRTGTDAQGVRVLVSLPGLPGQVPLTSPSPGMRRHTATGFTIDVPARLRVTPSDRGVLFHENGLRIRVTQAARPAVTALQAAEDAAAKARYPGYTLIRVNPVRPSPYPQAEAADWEYTYRSGGTTVHVLSRWVAAPGGVPYVISWSAPERAWARHATERNIVLESFLPTAGSTPAAT
ncbi:serine/threonine-protein kinase [Thermobispora bispora]|uniref:non-specific serine/threonine protein kinase n=1 Tax=Thermobispora bispora (strain ATCC 19993 / DSM 43833 / CBS 139.67 / JCM 10125 / KCTC 9307 / NBRC 14880 / R51) TaxID=469371 RepID=D6Y843_THEBD|nr:serine/threonine-protein kinase [Thermobispora bispora]ADG89779.1 serine/threonine protein kinase [Thermobispora bispora DSM 43833]